jgi:hypothetical protein
VVVRVVDYRLEGVPDAEPLYRLLVTTLLDPGGCSTLAPRPQRNWRRCIMSAGKARAPSPS